MTIITNTDTISDLLHYDFDAGPNNIIQIILNPNTKANVQLLDELNFENYKNGRKYSYFGDIVDDSTSLRPPRYGHWHLIIDQPVTVNLI
jgi:hypothetical protein